MNDLLKDTPVEVLPEVAQVSSIRGPMDGGVSAAESTVALASVTAGASHPTLAAPPSHVGPAPDSDDDGQDPAKTRDIAHTSPLPHPGFPGDGREPAKPPSPATCPSPPDQFDPEYLRISQDFPASIKVKKHVVTIPVQKPPKDVFVRTQRDPRYSLQTNVIELKEKRETYLVAPSIWDELAGESTLVPKRLVTTITRQGVVFVWPIRLPGPDGEIDEWNGSALQAADAARDNWVRVTANMNRGAYDVHLAAGITVEPIFPDLPMKEILRIAFKGRYIDSLDHPVLRELRGEV